MKKRRPECGSGRFFFTVKLRIFVYGSTDLICNQGDIRRLLLKTWKWDFGLDFCAEMCYYIQVAARESGRHTKKEFEKNLEKGLTNS